MSFGFSPADLKGVIKLCNWMRENCFDKDGTADERYKRLKNSVKGLQDQVVRLHSVIETSLATRSYNPGDKGDEDLQREFRDVAGDVFQTLRKCHELLRNPSHVRLDRTRAGIIKNITWGATVQPAVDQLIGQLQFHINRLQIILEPVKVGDLAIIRHAVLELLETSRGQNPELRAQASDLVPGWLSDVFEANSRINAPPGVASILDIGVKDGCDLLYRAFSSRNSHDSRLDARGCAIRRYLNILKCQWLINTLRKTAGFPRHPSGSAFSIFVSNIEVSLCHDLQTISRTPGASVSDRDLGNLFAQADKPFFIWDAPTIRRLRSPTEREVGEEHILTVGLATNGPKEELIFFKKGQTDFRLVPTEETDEGKTQLSPYLKEERFNLCVDKFVPRYAVDDAGILGLIPMDLYLQGHANPVTYHMKDHPDAWAFQRAITGYEIIGNECNVRWNAQKEFQSMRNIMAKSRRVALRGCVQVWRWDPYKETLPAPEQTTRTSVDSPDSSESGTMTLSPATCSIAPSQRTVNSFAKTERTIHGGVLEQLHPPTAPVIAAFGHSGGFYRCYILQLRSDLIIDTSACQCTLEGDGGDCKTLVIQSTSGSQKTFDIQDLSVPDNSISNWNLAVFRGPGRSPEASNQDIVKHLSCENLRLDFDTPEERQFFSDAFWVAIGEYNEALTEYEDYKEQLRMAGERPRGPSRSVYGTPASSVASMSRASSVSYRPVSDTAPRLEPVAAFSRLSLGGFGRINE